MTDVFRFRLYTDARFGLKISKDIGDLLNEKGFSKPIVFVDHGVYELEAIRDMLESLKRKCNVLKVFKNKVAEPTYTYLDEANAEFKGLTPDCVIGIGGGSTIDLAKGIASLMTNPGKGIEYRGFNLLKNRSLPIIAVPTTAGTGSEVTPFAVFTESSEKRKLGINSDYNFPTLAILDPTLISSCPRKIAISSGMDAIVHSVESFVAKVASPSSKIYAKEAFRLLFNNLEEAVKNPRNMEPQSKILLGSHYAGISLLNSGAGPSGALSYPLGTYFNVPHGIAGAVFLPKVIEINVKKGCVAYNPLYDLIERVDLDLSEEKKAKEFAKRFRELCDRLDVPKKLNCFGVKKEDQQILEKESKWLKGALDMNPIPFGEEEVKELLNEMIE